MDDQRKHEANNGGQHTDGLISLDSLPQNKGVPNNAYGGGHSFHAYGTGKGGGSGSEPGGKTMLRIVINRWPMVVLLAILGAVGGIFYAQVATPIYKVTAEIEMNVRRPKVINSDAVYEDPNAPRDTDIIFNTRFAKFRSPAMETLAAKEYMELYPEQTKTSDGLPISRYSLSRWVRDVNWYKDPTANIVYVSYSASDPEFAAQLVNVLTRCAGQLMMRENQAQSDEAVKWLVSQAKEQRENLEDLELSLANLRDEIQIDSLEQRKAELGQALVTVSEEKEASVSQLNERTSIFDFVSNLRDNDPNLEMLPSGLPKEKELDELIRSWRLANDELLRVADRYKPIHPEYKKAAEIEARAQERLNQFIEMSEKAVQNEIQLLRTQIEQTESRVVSMKAEAVLLEKEIAAGLRQLQRLERDRDATSDSLQAILRRMEEARLSADENMAFTKVIRSASVPRVPVSPRKPRLAVMGAALGFVFGSLLTIVMAFWTDKIGTVADLKALNLNVMASIPTQKKVDSRGQLATIGLRDKFSPMVEVFAGINSVLTSKKYREQTRAMLICSVGPGEGKTISACNLAISFALNGSKTLLIDGDLRRPQLGNVFQVGEDRPSLLDWLNEPGDRGCDQLISASIIENLDVITSRPHGQINPAELLGRGQVAELLTWAREHYDRVLIDTPPIGPVGDAQVLANLVDGVIMVARIGKTKRRAIKFAVTRFEEIDAPIFGWIANDVSHSLAGMFGGAEGYGFSYGYGGYKAYK